MNLTVPLDGALIRLSRGRTYLGSPKTCTPSMSFCTGVLGQEVPRGGRRFIETGDDWRPGPLSSRRKEYSDSTQRRHVDRQVVGEGSYDGPTRVFLYVCRLEGDGSYSRNDQTLVQTRGSSWSEVGVLRSSISTSELELGQPNLVYQVLTVRLQTPTTTSSPSRG